jgi:hypothetical protein
MAGELVEDRTLTGTDAGGVLLTLAIVLPLLWRRQRPGLVLVISGTALLGYDAAGYPSGLAWLACYWAVYSYAVHRSRRDACWPLAVWVAEIVAHLVLPARGSDTAQTALIFLGVTAVVWIRGDAVRSGLGEAERQRELRVRQAVADERTRIARELQHAETLRRGTCHGPPVLVTGPPGCGGQRRRPGRRCRGSPASTRG